MTDFNFGKWNKILGWLVFAIALATYSSTLEPTASFWDAGEYIATSANLEVGHPPGAPFYQMMGAFFSTFAPDNSKVALMVNFMSGLASAFTILFMFWSITLLLLKITGPVAKLSASKKMAILGSAMVGSLAFTFTDSFWFSAVEAEVYAMASCFMAIMFYLGLLWERDMFTPRGNRWVILISLVIGLSFGVHFLGLLTIPAIGFLYFFKNYKKVTVKNFIIANIVVVAVLLFIFKLLLPYTLTFFAASEVFFTNSLGMPFNTGTIIAFLVIITAFYFGINYTRKKNYYQLNTLLLCILFILIGFSSWIMLPIRSNAPTVINENSPDNARELLAYYNREQYGETYLFYGPQWSEMYSGLDEDNPYMDAKPIYEKNEELGKYVIVNDYKNARQNLDDNHKAFLPRMWSTEHAVNYMEFTGPLDFTVKPEYQGEQQLMQAINEFRTSYSRGQLTNEDYHNFLRRFSDYIDVEKPSFASNIAYLLEYQIGYMYWRYFMWNFVGRQDDIQGKYTDLNGNWISGIDFIDRMHVGPQENLPSDALNNKARNTYYFLPLIVGLIGLVFQFKKDKNTFWVLLVFFLFTGIALKIYLNERPFEPRERDYALVGSFYVFAIWIGFGVYALIDKLKAFVKPKIAVPVVVIATLLAVPTLMASENWDDHDRSNKFTALAMAKMYLDSVEENGIIFTIGDNDTFALWYAQQVEKYRTDVRVINTSLFATDWYIDQMKRKAFESDAIPSQLSHDFYTGKNDAIFLEQRTNDTLDISTWLNFIQSDDPRTKAELQGGQSVNTYPTQFVRIPVDKQAVLENGIVQPDEAGEIVDHIDIKIDGRVLYKNRLMMLDIIANNNWERPIYFTGGSFGDEDYLWMKDYLQLEGVAYKLVPIRTPVDPRNPFDMGRVNTQKMYNIVKHWDWGNMGDPNIYHDPETRKNAITYRSNLARLVENLLRENDTTAAKEILDLAMEKMPIDEYGYYSLLEPYINGYYEVNEPEKAREIWEQVAQKYQENLKYYSSWDLDRQYRYADEIISNIERYRSLVDLLVRQKDEEIVREKAEEFNEYLRMFRHFYAEEEEIPETNPQQEIIEDQFDREMNPQGRIDSLPVDSLKELQE
ncbi:protein O-mannosyl-transferase family [Zunongwangia sp. H14]|uniref:glycosyltransferase family 117 protein n=1 Tax=Zunongwangia sp. H14 TaxID=3240792 RepID=UPI003568D184